MALRGRRSLVVASALLAAAGCAGAPGGQRVPLPEPPRPKGIVLVTMEGWWAPGEPEDPFGPDFLPGAVRFPDAMTPCPQVRPAVASVLTGQAPDRLGVHDNANTPLAADVPSLPLLLARRGWESAAFIANPLLGFGSGLEQGFGLVDAPKDYVFGPFRRFPPARSPEEIGDNMISWVSSLPPTSSFFAWAHVAGLEPPRPRTRRPRPSEPRRGEPAPAEPTRTERTPGEPAPTEPTRTERTPGEPTPTEPRPNAPTPNARTPNEPATSPARVREAVREAARRLAEAARGRDVSLVVVGAVGRLDPSRGELSGYFLTPEVLRVPFFHLRLGAAPAEEPASGAAVWLPDVAALVAKEAGIEAAFADGAWPPPPSRSGSEPRRAWTWLGAREFGWAAEWAVVARDLLVVKESRATAVAYSWRDGTAASGETPRDLVEALEQRPGYSDDPFRTPPALPDDLREAVAKAGVEIPAAPEPAPQLSRQDRMATIPLLHKARRLALERAPRRAKQAYEELQKADPSNAGAALEAAEALAGSRMARLARPKLESALSRRPGWAEVWHWLGHVAYLENNPDRARASWLVANFLAPGHADTLYDLACGASLEGDVAAAEDYLRRAWAAGFRLVNHIQGDPDLRNLREDPRFARFMQEVVR